jgi:hypothetical protein
VNASSDTTPPATPAGLQVTDAGPSEVHLAWDKVADTDLAFYELQRAPGSGGEFLTIGRSTQPSYTDTAVSEGQTLRYRVLAVDTSFNRSDPSAAVTATAEVRKVSLTFTVKVPDSTDGTGRAMHIAGTLDVLDGGLPQWDPTGGTMTRVDATTWRITVTGMENTALQYKYVLGDWNYVEKTSTCAEVDNRLLTVSYGTDGTQQVSDTVAN